MQPQFDTRASLAQARARFPLERVMEHFGHAPRNGNWKSFVCPHCKSKGKSSGLFKTDGVTLFKCHHVPCPTNNDALDETGYVRLMRGISQKDAFREFLQMAGVWQELPPRRDNNSVAESSRPTQPRDDAPQDHNAPPGESPSLDSGGAIPSPEQEELLPPEARESRRMVEAWPAME